MNQRDEFRDGELERGRESNMGRERDRDAGSRGYWRERPSWQQDPYGFSQRTHWHDQNREHDQSPFRQDFRTRYREMPSRGEYSDESAMSYENQNRRDYRAATPTPRYPRGPKGYQRSDERLKEDISERLMEAYHIDSSEVLVEVRGAKVSLEGTVPSRHMKHAIEDLVDRCPGVLDIDNRIRVAGLNYQGSAPTMSQSQSQGQAQPNSPPLSPGSKSKQ